MPTSFSALPNKFSENQHGGEYFYAKFVSITNKREEK
jgi:hypothetical protein